MAASKKKQRKALTTYLPPDIAVVWDSIVEQVQSQVPVPVSESQVLLILVVEEAKRRKIKR